MPWGNVSTYMYFKPSSKDAYVTNINFFWHFCFTTVKLY